MSENIYDKLGQPSLMSTNRTLTGFGNTTIKPLGVFVSHTGFGDEERPTKIFVVQQIATNFPIITGTKAF